MKILYPVFLVILLANIGFSQQTNIEFFQKSSSTYTHNNNVFTIYNFISTTSLTSTLEEQVLMAFATKEDIKTPVYNASTNQLTVIVKGNITVRDLNRVLDNLPISLSPKNISQTETGSTQQAQ